MRFGGTNNVIGGSASGARNVISAAGLVGIQFDGTGVEGNLIQGNYIGTDITGTVAFPNQNGVVFTSGATNNTVGGVAAGEGNIIAANLEIGVEISNSSDNVVLGNEIGVDGAGAALGNGIDGVGIIGPATGNTIGGTTAAVRNVISGQSGANAFGVYISGADATGNSVLGNYIGSDVSGSAALPNTTGIGIANSSGNTVGGTIAGAGNVVSGNGDYGVRLTGSAAIDNLVAGNYIGTNAAGTAAIPNASAGVLIDSGAAGNTIGGTTAAASNVISGNTTDGVEISGTGTSGNVVDGNFVGTDLTGTFAIANATGVEIDSGASANTIGGTAAGVLNVISGNTVAGAEITGAGTSANVVAGDFIGTDITGTLALGNGTNGVEILTSASGNTIGGTTAGARNIISGNSPGYYGTAGVLIGVGADGNVVEGDYIGTDVTGDVSLSNYDGIFVLGLDNTIGGTASGAGNVISGNDVSPSAYTGLSAYFAGIQLMFGGEYDYDTTGNIAEGNLIGLNANGKAIAGATNTGVYINYDSSGNSIGGTLAARGMSSRGI